MKIGISFRYEKSKNPLRHENKHKIIEAVILKSKLEEKVFEFLCPDEFFVVSPKEFCYKLKFESIGEALSLFANQVPRS